MLRKLESKREILKTRLQQVHDKHAMFLKMEQRKNAVLSQLNEYKQKLEKILVENIETELEALELKQKKLDPIRNPTEFEKNRKKIKICTLKKEVIHCKMESINKTVELTDLKSLDLNECHCVFCKGYSPHQYYFGIRKKISGANYRKQQEEREREERLRKEREEEELKQQKMQQQQQEEDQRQRESQRGSHRESRRESHQEFKRESPSKNDMEHNDNMNDIRSPREESMKHHNLRSPREESMKHHHGSHHGLIRRVRRLSEDEVAFSNSDDDDEEVVSMRSVGASVGGSFPNTGTLQIDEMDSVSVVSVNSNSMGSLDSDDIPSSNNSKPKKSRRRTIHRKLAVIEEHSSEEKHEELFSDDDRDKYKNDRKSKISRKRKHSVELGYKSSAKSKNKRKERQSSEPVSEDAMSDRMRKKISKKKVRKMVHRIERKDSKKSTKSRRERVTPEVPLEQTTFTEDDVVGHLMRKLQEKRAQALDSQIQKLNKEKKAVIQERASMEKSKAMSVLDLETYRNAKKKQKQLKRSNVRRASTIGFIEPSTRRDRHHKEKARTLSVSHDVNNSMVNLEDMLKNKDIPERRGSSRRKIIRRQRVSFDESKDDTASKPKSKSTSQSKTRIPIKRKRPQ